MAEQTPSILPMRVFVSFECEAVRASAVSEEEWERNFRASVRRVAKLLLPKKLKVTAVTVRTGFRP